MRMGSYLIALMLVATAYSSQYVPISSQPDGISKGFSDAPVVFEAFLDFSCSDSMYSYNQLKLAFRNETLIPYLDQIRTVIHNYPLPYHNTGFYLGVAFNYVSDVFGTEAAFEYIDSVFENQSGYYNNQTLSTFQVKQMIAMDAQIFLNKYGVNFDDVMQAFSDQQYLQETVNNWKFGAGRAVSATPFFFVNQVFLNDGADYDSDSWVDFFFSVFNPDDILAQY